MTKTRKKSEVFKNKKAYKDLLKRCFKLKQQKKGVETFLKNEGIEEQDREKIKKALNNYASDSISQEEKENNLEWGGNLKFTDKYVYNKEDDKYVMYLRAAAGNIVLRGDVVREIKESYSNWYGDPHSVNQLCRNHKIPRNYLVEILRVLGITHDSEPVTDEQLKEKGIDEIAGDILQKQKFQLYQEVQKRSWKDTEEAAQKWYRFSEGVFTPFTNFISSWQPPKYSPVKYTGPAKHNEKKKALLVGLSDVHFGAKSNVSESYREKGYSTAEASMSIIKYANDIGEIVKDRSYGFDECILAALGDIIHTTGSGFTTKGTPLVHDCIKEEQFSVAFNTIIYLIDSLLALFPKVSVKSVKGNHNDFGDWVLFKALEAYYRTEKRISFDVFQTDHGLFKVKNTLFVASHGYSAEYRGKLPSKGKARESYVANLFLSKPEVLVGVKQKVLLTADQHHLEMQEYAEFEHYMLSTTVNGDKHSEAMGLNNIARQTCFSIDDNGIKEVIYCYSR